jgi:hypothetical protein
VWDGMSEWDGRSEICAKVPPLYPRAEVVAGARLPME